MNDLSLAWSMLTSPLAAFAELRERPRFWFPLIASIATTAILLAWYYGIVDFDWYKENFLSTQLKNVPEATRTKMLAAISQRATLWSSVVMGAIAVPITLAIQAACYMLVGKVAGVADSFKRWFVQVCWSNAPILVGFVVSAIMLLTSGSQAQIDPGAMQPLSLNELFFQRAPGMPGYALLISLSLLSFWIWGLRVICIRTWHNKSWTLSAVVGLLPVAVFYSVWAIIAFR